MSFRYEKETLFAEFEVAKQKDIKLSKKKTLSEKEVDRYDNRIQFFKDHIELKAKHPEYYEDVDVKFDKLLALYQTPNPRDSFYMAFFGMTYAEKMRITEIELAENRAERGLGD
jgi:hypothetical protein